MIDPKVNALRLAQVINRQQPDRAPVFLPIESGFMAEFGGAPQSEYHNDPEKMLDCQAGVQERFGGLTPLYTDFGVVTEAAAFCEVYWPDDDSPWAMPALKSIEEAEDLEVPDVTTDGLFPRIIEYFESMNEMANERGLEAVVSSDYGPVGFGSLRGPVVLAAMIRGITDFLMDLLLHPEECHALMEVATETILAYLDLQRKKLGRISALFLCDDVSGLLSPRLYEEFFIPYVKRIFEAHPDSLTIYHCDSDMLKTVNMAPATGAKAFHMGYMHDLRALKRDLGDKMALIGNVPPVQVLMRSTPDEVSEICRRFLRAAMPGGGFALSAGGVINRGAPPENIDAMIEATEKYGKY